jgi:hypothetical protein
MSVVDAEEFLRDIYAKIANAPASMQYKPNERFHDALDEALKNHEIAQTLLTDAQKQSIYQYLSIEFAINRFTDSLLEQRLGITVRESSYETAGNHLLSGLSAMHLGFDEAELIRRITLFERQINTLPISNQTNHVATQIAAKWLDKHQREVREIIDTLCVDLPKETRRDHGFLDYARELVRDQLLHHDRPMPSVAARILGREPQDVTRELSDVRHTVGELLRFSASSPRVHLEHVMREFINKGEHGLPQLQSRAR